MTSRPAEAGHYVASPARRRILIALPEPAYFRLYGSTILELGQRGHEVLLAYDRPNKRGEGPQVPAGASSTIRSVGALPQVAPERWIDAWRAAVDYMRYLEPEFERAVYLRQRAEKTLPRQFAFLTRLRRLPRIVMSAAIGLMRVVERVTPADEHTVRFLRDAAPDVILVSPLVTLGESARRQTEIVKAARRLRVPVVVGAASWDHLTSKGLVRIVPDALAVWNESQVAEAVRLHRIPSRRVIVTGAQSLDHWFEPSNPDSTSRFRERLGIDADRRVILFVGSSRNMAPGDSEPNFVRRWLDAVRSSSSPSVRNAFVIVRPHPTNTSPWQQVALASANATVHPAEYSGIPLTDAEVETFRQSMLASHVVVGINTTAMIEAAILGRPVLTIRDREFSHSQEQTLHFAHLRADAGGCALVASDLQAHLQQLDQVLRDPSGCLDASSRFVRSFVRPHGLSGRAADVLCDAIQRCAGGAKGHTRVSTAKGEAAEDLFANPRRSVR